MVNQEQFQGNGFDPGLISKYIGFVDVFTGFMDDSTVYGMGAAFTALLCGSLNFFGHIFIKFDIFVVLTRKTAGHCAVQLTAFRINYFLVVFLYPDGLNERRLTYPGIF